MISTYINNLFVMIGNPYPDYTIEKILFQDFKPLKNLLEPNSRHVVPSNPTILEDYNPLIHEYHPKITYIYVSDKATGVVLGCYNAHDTLYQPVINTETEYVQHRLRIPLLPYNGERKADYYDQEMRKVSNRILLLHPTFPKCLPLETRSFQNSDEKKSYVIACIDALNTLNVEFEKIISNLAIAIKKELRSLFYLRSCQSYAITLKHFIELRLLAFAPSNTAYQAIKNHPNIHDWCKNMDFELLYTSWDVIITKLQSIKQVLMKADKIPVIEANLHQYIAKSESQTILYKKIFKKANPKLVATREKAEYVSIPNPTSPEI